MKAVGALRGYHSGLESVVLFLLFLVSPNKSAIIKANLGLGADSVVHVGSITLFGIESSLCNRNYRCPKKYKAPPSTCHGPSLGVLLSTAPLASVCCWLCYLPSET